MGIHLSFEAGSDERVDQGSIQKIRQTPQDPFLGIDLQRGADPMLFPHRKLLDGLHHIIQGKLTLTQTQVIVLLSVTVTQMHMLEYVFQIGDPGIQSACV